MVVLLTAVVSDPETLDDMSARGAEIDEIDRRMSEEIRNMTQLDLAYETLGSGFLLIITGIGGHALCQRGLYQRLCEKYLLRPAPPDKLCPLQGADCRGLQRRHHPPGRAADSAGPLSVRDAPCAQYRS